MVDGAALLGIILLILAIGAEIGLYAHLLQRQMRARCPRCGTKNIVPKAKDLAIHCRTCGTEYRVAMSG